MLNGIDPIIIFQFSKLANTALASVIGRIPIVSEIPTLIPMPPIPIYLSETLTEIQVDNESKNVDLETNTETMSDATTPDVNQRGIGNVVSINLTAKKSSVGVTLLSAMIDQLFDKATSKEYAITYLHGPITVFGGVLHSYSVEQGADNDLLSIKIELSKGQQQPVKPPGIPSVPGIEAPFPGG